MLAPVVASPKPMMRPPPTAVRNQASSVNVAGLVTCLAVLTYSVAPSKPTAVDVSHLIAPGRPSVGAFRYVPLSAVPDASTAVVPLASPRR